MASRKKRLVTIVFSIALLVSLLLLTSCGSDTAGSDENKKPTASELLDRAVAWVKEAPTQAEMPGGRAQDRNRVRVYGAGGLPIEWDAEPDPPFSLLPMIFDGPTYFLAIPGSGAEKKWVKVPASVAASESERSQLGDLNDSIAWFWLVDPYTNLRATLPEGEPSLEADGAWTIRGKIDAKLLEGVLPHNLDESYLKLAAGWPTEVEVTSEGAIRRLRVTMFPGSPEEAASTWSWSRATSGPVIPKDAIDFKNAKLN